MIDQIRDFLSENLQITEQQVAFKTKPVPFSELKQPDFDTFLLKAQQVDFPKLLLDAALLNASQTVENGQNQQLFTCCFSVMSDDSYNFLVCEVAQTQVLVAQHVSSADFIYIPQFNALASLCHINNDLAAGALSRLQKVLSEFSVNAAKSTQLSFGGVIASHGRPAHFFYDTALAAEVVIQQFCFESALPVYQIKGGDFADLPHILGESYFKQQGTVSHAELNAIACKNGLLFIKLGSFYGFGNAEKRAFLECFDQRLLRAAQSVNSALVTQIKQYQAEGYFILWHGITTEKRRWLEQETAIVDLITTLQEMNKRVCLIIDGWTKPMSETDYDLMQISSDLTVYEHLKSLLPESCVTTSLIGQPAILKAAVANLIDFHVSNGGTGSLYVSRVARKRGVLHISNTGKASTGQSIHFNSQFIPAYLVLDKPDPEVEREDYVSYSIAASKFVEFSLHVMDEEIDSRKLYLSQVIGCHFNQQGYDFFSYDNDPILFFSFAPELFSKASNVSLLFQISTSLPLTGLNAKLYLDYGEGFSEDNALKAEYSSDGIVTFTVANASSLVNFRFDPFACVGAFTLVDAKVL